MGDFFCISAATVNRKTEKEREFKVSSRALLNSFGKLNVTFKRSLILITMSLFALVNITGCGSNDLSMELPNDFIQSYIAKHETMVDESLVYYYVKSDQPEVAEQIDVSCRINRSKGTFEILEKATFDFSELQIQLVDKKEVYVNDEPVMFAKVAVKGSYKMLLEKETQKIEANEVIILQMARNEWKVTKSNNPWS
jgi:hypothetical protein